MLSNTCSYHNPLYRRVMPEWPWSDLPRHAAVIDALRGAVDASDAWRWLEVCCSLAAGRGDEWSDVDAGVGYGDAFDPADLDTAGVELVHAAGEPVDVLAHVMPGWPPETRRFAVEYRNGVQLDLVLMPATRRVGLPTGAVAVVDKDGDLAEPWSPPVEGPPSPAEAREWLMLGWWAVSDVAKYARRGSLFEAVERLTEARQHALRLHAAAAGVPFPSFGLVSLLDFPPFELPPGLAATYATPTSVDEVLAAARAIADLLPPSPWEAPARERLGGVSRR